MFDIDQAIWSRFIQVVKSRNYNAEEFNHPFLRRLLGILKGNNGSGLDLAYAIRDVLACAQTHQFYGTLTCFDPRLSAEIIDQVGITRHGSSTDLCLVEPIWTEHKDVYQKVQRRFIQSLALDPVVHRTLKRTPIRYYNGEGQRQAIRTILTSPNNSVIFIQLPTGCGKTLAIHTLSLVARSNHLILVIVPTVGLGIEQSLRVKEILTQADLDHGGSYVWHSLTHMTERMNILQRMSAGTQRVLFCSPEVAVTSLRSQLFELAERQLLGSIVVDEAHLIDTWGAEFRPEFQLLSALVRSLKRYQQTVRLILMSATFSQNTWDLLKKLFTEPDSPFLFVNGGFLRPEINFKLLKTKDAYDHEKQVLACLHHLPRPIILYSVKREDAEYWHRKLQETGFRRLGLFHGDTKVDQRNLLIQEWKADRIDIMVATSAFGVGMDKSDVHSVLHTAVPENMDRFYQEAGRGGRDGAACLSYLIYYNEQIEVAQRIAESKLISVEKGLRRWINMCNSHNSEKANRMNISLTTFTEDIDVKSDYNLDWNIRTLLLMQRAELIRLYYIPNEKPAEHLTEDAKRQHREYYKDRIYIDLLNDGHKKESVWQSVVETQRTLEKRAQWMQFQQLLNWLQEPEKPLCQRLEQFYALDGYLPEYSCGGCPGCLAEQRRVFTPTLGHQVNGSHLNHDVLFPTTDYVYYPAHKTMSAKFRELYVQEWKIWIEHLLKSKKIGAIRASRQTLDRLTNLDCVPFWAGIEFNEPAIGVPELVLILPTEQLPKYSQLQNLPSQIIVAPEDLPDLQFSHRLWWETKPHSQRLNDFINRE